jgi:hypothetical protein
MIARLLAVPLAVRLGATVWVALLLGVTGRTIVARPACQSVVPIYHAAGERFRAGDDLYRGVPGLDAYRNPPGVAAGFGLVSDLPPKPVALLWRLGTAGLFLAGLIAFRRAVAPDLSPVRTGAMLALAAVIALPAVNNGQVNVPIAGAGLLAAVAVARCGWTRAAGWLAVAAGLKAYPLALGLLYAATAPRRLALRLAVAVTVIVAIPFALQSPDYVAGQYERCFTSAGADDRTHSIPDRTPRDWTTVPRAWLGVIVPGPVAKGVSVLAGVVAAGLAVSIARRTSAPDAAGRVLVLGTAWMTAFGPATEPNTYALFAGCAAWLAVVPGGPKWARACAITGAGLLAGTVVRGAFPGDPGFNGLGPQPVGALLLAITAVGCGNRNRVEPAVVRVARIPASGGRLPRVAGRARAGHLPRIRSGDTHSSYSGPYPG